MIPMFCVFSVASRMLPWPWLVATVLHGVLAVGWFLLGLGGLFLPGQGGSGSAVLSEDRVAVLVAVSLVVAHVLVCWGLGRLKRWGWGTALVLDILLCIALLVAANTGASALSGSASSLPSEFSILPGLWVLAALYGANAGLVVLGWLASSPSSRS